MIKSWQASQWEVVHGQIITSRIFEDDNFQTHFGLGGGELSEVRYRYQFHDRTYESDVVTFLPNQIGGNAHYYPGDMARRYPLDENIAVRVNIAHPEQAVLDNRIMRQTYIRFAIGMILAAVAGIIYFRRTKWTAKVK